MIRKVITALMLTTTLARAGTFTSVTNGWYMQRTNVINEIIESLYARGAYTSTPPYVMAGSNVQSRAFLAGLQTKRMTSYPATDRTFDDYAEDTFFGGEFVNGIYGEINYSGWVLSRSLATCSTSLWFDVTGGDGTSGPRRATEYSHTNTWRNYDDLMYSYGVCTNGDITGPWIPFDFQMALAPLTNAVATYLMFPMYAYTNGALYYVGTKATNEAWSVAWGNLAPSGPVAISLQAPGFTGYAAEKFGNTEIRAIIIRATVPIDSLWLSIPHKYARNAYMTGRLYGTDGFTGSGNHWLMSAKQAFDTNGIATVTFFTNNLPATIPPDADWNYNGQYSYYVDTWANDTAIVIEIEPPYTQ